MVILMLNLVLRDLLISSSTLITTTEMMLLLLFFSFNYWCCQCSLPFFRC